MFEGKSSQLCRLCLKSGACPIDIYDPKRTNGFLVWEIIEELTEIKIYISDGLPPNICENCMKKLTDFKYFKKMCIDSRLEYLFRRMNNGLVVPLTEDESDILGEDLCGQGDVHAGGNNLEARGIESEAQYVLEDPPPQEEDCSIRDGNCFDGEVHCSDVFSSEYVMHVKHGDFEQEIHLPEEYLSSSMVKHSLGEMKCIDVCVSASEVTTDEEELMDQEDLCLHLSSSSSDEGSDVEERALSITGPEAEVNDVNCTDEVSVPVDGGIEELGNTEETLIRERGADRVKWTGHQMSARKEHDAFVPVATRSHLKQRTLRSNCDEGIDSTPSSTTGELFCEENGGHTERKEEARRESKLGNCALAGNISTGSSVGDEKSEGQDFICDECGKVFRSKDLIERHLNVPSGSELIDCGNRNKKFRTRKQYKRHRSLHCGRHLYRGRVASGVADDVCGEAEGKRQYKKRIPATCLVCNKTFSQKSGLNRHVKIVHLKERKFSCEICGKSFGLKGTLQTHMRYHNGVKPYTCSHCQKCFTESGDLRTHIRAVHEMEKPYTCGECGKAFSYRHNVKAHMLVHTGERPHTCDICSMSFSLKQHLRFHMLIHTGEKPHTCTLCSKTFRQIGHLKGHMATHARNVPHP